LFIQDLLAVDFKEYTYLLYLPGYF